MNTKMDTKDRTSNTNDQFLTYPELLSRIQGRENHLLIGNGFNMGLGVNTSYDQIFQKMKNDKYSVYLDMEQLYYDSGCDLEAIIEKLQSDISEENLFLRKFVENKIKHDFMKALQSIVSNAIKNVYTKKNAGIYILLKHFTNYFTLNYDSFLYLLLLKFKPNGFDTTETSFSLFANSEFIKKELDTTQESIYSIMKHLREHGASILKLEKWEKQTPLKSLTKDSFVDRVKTYADANNLKWTKTDIEKVFDYIIREEREQNVDLTIDDGFRLTGNSLIYDEENITQNLFFLHGAFHLIKDGKVIKKITQDANKSLYKKLSDIINNKGGKEILCVFQAENKLQSIEQEPYLSNCLNKLNLLKGSVVILGCSLSDNDDHIFERINHSEVDTVYVSYFNKAEDTLKHATSKFPDKNVYVFDSKTISYNLPQINN